MMLRDLLAVNNVKIRANTLISAVTDEGAVVLANDGTESVIEADTVIFAIGLKPNKSYARGIRCWRRQASRQHPAFHQRGLRSHENAVSSLHILPIKN